MTVLPDHRRVRHLLLIAIAAQSLLAVASSAETTGAPRRLVSIRSDFPGGNVVVTENTERRVHVEPDLRGDRPWFYWCFEATATQPGRVDFIFPEKVVGFTNGAIGRQGPAISVDDGKTWNWMGVDQVEGPSFRYDFAKEGDRVRFAVTIPYLERDLDAFLKANASNPHLARDVLTKSRHGREVELLRIGSPGEGRKPMLVTGRHHAAESMASFVLEGFLAEAMSESPSGKAFREKHVLFAVPFVDKDGVQEGDQGKNRSPHDHNRDYVETSIYPEVRAIKELDKTHDFRFALDFHCPTLVMNDHQVMYFMGAKDEPQYNHENVAALAKGVKNELPDGAPFGPLNWLRDEASPSPTNARYFGVKDNAILSATFEFPYAPPGKAMAPENCRRYGRAMLRAWTEIDFREPDEAASTDNAPRPVAAAPQDTVMADDFSWLPPEANGAAAAPPATDAAMIPEVAITTTPKPTAELSRYTREYVIDLEQFGISNDGTDASKTSKGLNAALQHAKTLDANRIVFPSGVYLISATDPIVIDHRDTVIDLNGATLQIEANSEPRYSIVDIVDGAENIRLTNGALRGDKEEHDYSSNNGAHEWGHGLVFHGGRNIEADHLTITRVTGDGANTRATGARTRPELPAKIMHSVYKKHLEQGAFSTDGRKIDDTAKTRTIEPFDLGPCDGEFEFGYSAGYMGYPFISGRVYQAYFYDAGMNFLAREKRLQFRKTRIPEDAKYVHLEFNQHEIPDEPLHSGAARGSFVGRISNFKGPVDVHFHHNKLVGNRRLGLGYCGGRRWLIEDNLFAENGGTAPGYGIDLEDGWEFMQDVVIRDNQFRNNRRGDLVVSAGSELLIEGNTFESNVVVHARPHNYTFRNNKFQGGHVGYKTRTGIARIHDNRYENCTLSITFDSKGVADGINHMGGRPVTTPPIRLVDEALVNVKRITGTYFNFSGAALTNAHFEAGEDTRLVDFEDCDFRDCGIHYEADGPPVEVRLLHNAGTLARTGPGLNRRRVSGEQ